jgi:hypothetical protein
VLIIDINEGSLCAALEYLCQLGISAASCLADTADKPLRAAHGPGSSGALWRVGHHGNARFHMQGDLRPAQSHLHSRCLRGRCTATAAPLRLEGLGVEIQDLLPCRSATLLC